MNTVVHRSQSRDLTFGAPVLRPTGLVDRLYKPAWKPAPDRTADRGLTFGKPSLYPGSLVDAFDRLAMNSISATSARRGLTFGRPSLCQGNVADEFGKMVRETRVSRQPLVFHTNLMTCLDMYTPEYALVVISGRQAAKEEDHGLRFWGRRALPRRSTTR